MKIVLHIYLLVAAVCFLSVVTARSASESKDDSELIDPNCLKTPIPTFLQKVLTTLVVLIVQGISPQHLAHRIAVSFNFIIIHQQG